MIAYRFAFGLLLAFLNVFAAVRCLQFQVGGEDGWVVPKSRNDKDMYNDWASDNRFKIDDTLHFKYQKDSVLAVTEEEYDKCKSSHPMFFSNNGDTTFVLDRPGLFYFISGVSGHCERGQRMIIKVLDINSSSLPPSSSASQNSTADISAADALEFGFRHAWVGLLFKFLMV
ncbi:hypothetical protein MLD38_026205 [Melastoma candidum]|uniref:Uncharacterized protein n=1 Tax=Melastoma candidum TaxID=119954 RepID=A0ACB9NZP0_9MYRT|nr:hypothetical protein MLD38_026205 [Melastoma candidum]